MMDKNIAMQFQIMNKIILIGGSPTAGKSYAAKALAEELQMPWISTDIIREQMRWIVSKDNYPRLFKFFEGGAEAAVEYLTNNSAHQIVADQVEENEDVWKGVVGIVEGDYVWENFIVEGVAITPKLVSEQKWKIKKDIRSIFLIDEDRDRVRKTIFTRGLWDEADKYSDDVKEKEVEWVLAFNDWIKAEAQKYNMPVISVDRKDYLSKIKEFINESGNS
jgi:2-phosphoglycerate kinase